jgi:hypothetical protein
MEGRNLHFFLDLLNPNMPIFKQDLSTFNKHCIGGLFTNIVKYLVLFVIIYLHNILSFLLFHTYSCINVKEYQSHDIDKFFCSKCEPVSGPTVCEYWKLHF